MDDDNDNHNKDGLVWTGAPANYSVCGRSAQGQFTVHGLPERVHLDKVYLNGLHTLVPFWITNESDQTLELTMETTVARAGGNAVGHLKVQRHNANWAATRREQREGYVEVTKAGPGGEVRMVCSARAQREFSEVFNQLGGDSEVRVAAGATTELVLLFVADEAAAGRAQGGTGGSSSEQYLYAACSGQVAIGGGGDRYTSHVRASVCRTVLEMEPATLRIYLDDCVAGRMYERQLRVRNASAIELDWAMAVVEATDTESLAALQLEGGGAAGGSGGRLAGGSSTQLVVRYTPRTAGEFVCRFVVENSNDPANQRYLVFRARASQQQRARRLELLSAADVSFGNCTSGVWNTRDVTFKNISETPVVMRMRVEGNTAGLLMRSTVRTGAGSREEAQLDDALSRTDGTSMEGLLDKVMTKVGGSAEGSSAEGGSAAHFDEVLIKAGAERTVALALLGTPVRAAAVGAGQFMRQSFTLFCESSAAAGGTQTGADRDVERLSVPCTVNLCTAFVRVAPALLDFGSVDVGTLKTMYLRIENVSQVAAVVQCRLDSKVINCTRSPLTVAPCQAASVRVDIYPRRVNARYRKQIVVRNTLNRLNDCVVDVRSTHVDRRRVAFHNIFYKTLVPLNEQNFVDFGRVPLNARALRAIVLRNVCRCPVTVDLWPGEDAACALAVYVPAPAAEARRVARRLPLLERQAVLHSSIERFKESSRFEPPATATTTTTTSALRRIEHGHVCLVPFAPAAKTSPVDYLDVAHASTALLSTSPLPANHHDVALRSNLPQTHTPVTLDCGKIPRRSPTAASPHHSPADTASGADAQADLARARQVLDEILDGLDMVPPTQFLSPQAEDDYVRRQVDLRKYVELLVESGFLRPARRITLPAEADAPVIVMLQPVDLGGSAARVDANLYFRLVDQPRDLLPFTDGVPAEAAGSGYQLPVRRFLVQAAPYRSELDIGQKSINVGNMQADESSRKYLVVQNRSETPLMYAIRKTGSIASGDINFVDNNRYGVVRGLDSRKVVFVFCPSLNGVYNEQISIENVLDPCGAKRATLKAVVRRPSKFYIQSLLLRFDAGAEPLEIDRRSHCHGVQLLTVRNMTPKARQLLVRRVNEAELQAANGGVVLDPLFPADAAAEAGDAAPQLLDRETEEKIEALEQKLKIAARKMRPEKADKYRAKLAKLRGRDMPETGAVQITRQAGDTQVVLLLPANGDVSIPVVAVPRIADRQAAAAWLGGRRQGVIDGVRGQIAVHEEKDKDNVKIVALVGSVAVRAADLA
ncbi:hypothetical protein H4R24_005526 [Coemansia sp. RSA 988]|nr:hypothetical protein H4R24_005526 [Coemansia sp. RSA 988]